jgi:predicted ester cyclase
MLFKYSLHEPQRGQDAIKTFMQDFRAAFPDLNFWGTADLIAEGDYVVGRWEGGGTHNGVGLLRAGKCVSRARIFFVSKAAELPRKSVWMMASRR